MGPSVQSAVKSGDGPLCLFKLDARVVRGLSQDGLFGSSSDKPVLHMLVASCRAGSAVHQHGRRSGERLCSPPPRVTDIPDLPRRLGVRDERDAGCGDEVVHTSS